MKKLLALFLLAAVLCGCAEDVPADTTEQSTQASPVQTTAPAVTVPETTIPETTIPQVCIQVTFEHIFEEGREYARLTGTDESGSVVWTMETGHYDVSQLDRVSDVGPWQDRYYYVEDGSVVALNAADGSVLWTNSDFGGCLAGKDAALIEENGTVYLCGFFGPDFYGVNCLGTTIDREETFDPDYYWAYKLEKTDTAIVVHLSGGPEGDMGDPGYMFYMELPIPQF